tara:strand:+ start:234 stop:830 length:597 start_codon:yes stop_codon:yes gene_type:complete
MIVDEINKLSHQDWVEYKRQHKSKLLNSYPNYDFKARFEIIKEFKKILEEEGINLYLSGGTLLGVYRDGDFIEWDPDADMDVLYEELEPKFKIVRDKLIEMGYIVRAIDTYPKMKINVYHSGEKVGILAMYLSEDKKTRHRWIQKWPSSVYENPQKIKFKGVEFDTPNIEGYLNHTYGGDWKTPKRSGFFSKSVYNNE